MGRLIPSKERVVGTRRQYIGKLLIFCEGTTEYNYIDYFSKLINSKYTKITIEVNKEGNDIDIRNVGGNAQTVYNYANNFLEDDSNRNKYSLYEKQLIFDCDDPKNIQEVILEMINSKHGYTLLMSNLLFETWLLMHFETIDIKLTKTNTYKRLAEKLEIKEYTSKHKSNRGIIASIIGNGKRENVKNAIQNAKNLENEYKDLDYKYNINDMNPFTTMHKLIEPILYEIENG